MTGFDAELVNASQSMDTLTMLKRITSILKLDTNASTLQFVREVFENCDVTSLLIHVSRQNVFDPQFSEEFKQDLDMLAIVKKLKFYTNLPIGQTMLLLQQVAARYSAVSDDLNCALIRLVRDEAKLSSTRFKDWILTPGVLSNQKLYVNNNVALESIDPHAVYPTSIYRHSDGLFLASPDQQTFEAVMRTTLTTTIKITRKVLDPSNEILADVYRPLGRCVALIDDKVVAHYGKQLEEYMAHFGIKLVQLIHGGNEIDKDIQNVEQILIELKENGVARNEPVLIMGGGVIADIGGFATALYHRNTPYVMLCTSIVTGIDAGPSPRTCCDGFGFKNLYGAYHPPVLTLTDRAFWNTLHEGWIRHGIAEIIKMAVVKDISLFELIEQAGPRLIRTKFGTEGDTDEEFEKLCDLIVGKAMEGYVRSEYGNLWETHQCRPHAYGHTWSPGYELPAGMLHGHAVATCMGYGAYLAKLEGFISEAEMARILALLNRMELSMWHDIMDNHDLVAAANKKAHDKRGGNLCAPVPKTLGKCGYINSLPREKLDRTLDEYKAICKTYPRQGYGIDVHCHEVGLEDPSTVAGDALKGIADKTGCSAHKHEHGHAHAHAQPASYKDWIQEMQTKRNTYWEMNVQFEVASDTKSPPDYPHFQLFQEGAEQYAMSQTSVASKNLQRVATVTQERNMFAPCMVGTLESQFLKMQAMVSRSRRCLDVGTFTGMSALALAEGLPSDGKVVTLECDPEIAEVAKEVFEQSSVRDMIDLRVGKANELMQKLKNSGEKFDLIFLDADKENYIEYYELAMGGLLTEDGIILADNSLCALLYDATDMRSEKLHEFNQHVKNDARVEQVVLTIREGVTLIRRVPQSAKWATR
jgi:3-dehydroquinate synthase